MNAENTFPSYAVKWANQLGADPNSLERLKGGINNCVFRCCDKTTTWVIKGYPPFELGRRDRMEAEIQFLEYSNHVAPGFTPALIHSDPDRRCVVLENLAGSLFCEGVPPPKQAVEAAVRFMHLLNHDLRQAQGYIQLDAAEGFLSLRQHLSNLQGRLELMSTSHLRKSDKSLAETLLQHIRYEFDSVKERTNSSIDQGKIEDAINPDQICISPSDFGFHNAISTANGIKFIDFEFAGWDDPAKATLDFSFQPRVPVFRYGFPLLSTWNLRRQRYISKRCQYLAPILRLKWLCILLSVLDPHRLRRILQIAPDDEGILISQRLQKAHAYFTTIIV